LRLSRNAFKVGIMLPVRNRARILPFTLEKIKEQNYDLKSLGIKFLINDSEDRSLDIADEFCANMRDRMYRCDIIEMKCNMCRDIRNDRRHNGMLHHMAFLKNTLFSSMVNDGYDYLMYMDSDILLGNDTVRRLVDFGKDITAPLLDIVSGHYNYFMWDRETGKYKRGHKYPEKRFICDYTCGCYIIKGNMFKFVKFGHENQLGDDDTLMRICREKGIKIWMIPNLGVRHIYDIDRFLMENKR